MTDKTDSKEREAKAAETWLRDRYGAYRGHFAWRELEEAFLAGRASLAASAVIAITPETGNSAMAQGAAITSESGAANAGSEPVARVNDDGFIVEIGDLLIAPGQKLYLHPSPPEGMVMVPKDALSKCKVALERYSQVPPNYHNSVLRLRDSMRELLLAAWASAPPTSSADSRKGE